MTPLDAADVRDAAAVVRAMHELAARSAVPRLEPAHLSAMREANRRFAAAVACGDVEGALRADDELHGVLVTACGNGAAAATIARYTPLIRRLERQRFGEGVACGSAELHELLIDACADGDPAAAAAVTSEIWRVLEELAHP